MYIYTTSRCDTLIVLLLYKQFTSLLQYDFVFGFITVSLRRDEQYLELALLGQPRNAPAAMHTFRRVNPTLYTGVRLVKNTAM